MWLHNKQFSLVKILRWVFVQKPKQQLHQLWNDFGMIVQLNCDEARKIFRWISDYVSKVAV